VVFMLERWQIENQGAEQIAKTLTGAFDRFCQRQVQNVQKVQEVREVR
jgi:hypothetical protein